MRKLAACGKRRGATLLELVVTFALLALFCVGFVSLVSASVNVYHRIISEARGQEVGQILMEKIVGEISGAQGGVKTEYTLNIMNRGLIPAGEESQYLDGSYKTGEVIAFCNRTGSPIYITARDGYLLIHYRPVNDENKLTLKAVDWTFDNSVYNGFTVSALNFSLVATDGGGRTNMVRVDLTLQNGTGYKVSATEYVECYYFGPTEVNKIEYKGILTDEAYQAAAKTGNP